MSKQDFAVGEPIERILRDREKEYGSAYVDFRRIGKINKAIDCEPHRMTPEQRHAIYMVSVKISRLCHNPSHVDSINDIIGYMECYREVTDAEDSVVP